MTVSDPVKDLAGFLTRSVHAPVGGSRPGGRQAAVGQEMVSGSGANGMTANGMTAGQRSAPAVRINLSVAALRVLGKSDESVPADQSTSLDREVSLQEVSSPAISDLSGIAEKDGPASSVAGDRGLPDERKMKAVSSGSGRFLDISV